MQQSYRCTHLEVMLGYNGLIYERCVRLVIPTKILTSKRCVMNDTYVHNNLSKYMRQCLMLLKVELENLRLYSYFFDEFFGGITHV